MLFFFRLAVLCRAVLGTSWWLGDAGQSLGIEGEDINSTGFDSHTDDGFRVTIVSIADGANAYHKIYEDRSIPSEFLSVWDDAPLIQINDPEKNNVGQKSLGLAVGRPGYCKSDGVTNVMSHSGRNESLQSVLCHHSDKWDISLLTYKAWHCVGRECPARAMCSG
jgi:hypothetical protein